MDIRAEQSQFWILLRLRRVPPRQAPERLTTTTQKVDRYLPAYSPPPIASKTINSNLSVATQIVYNINCIIDCRCPRTPQRPRQPLCPHSISHLGAYKSIIDAYRTFQAVISSDMTRACIKIALAAPFLHDVSAPILFLAITHLANNTTRDVVTQCQ